ncbi:MAG: S9 family peptidase, partial [Saprospiraceae bacterium]|nr:S9 family peptidase [Saprospiraceae bacterium]
MKYIVLFVMTSLIALGTTVSAQNTPSPNYALADRFSPDNMEKMVFSTSVDPHWLKNSDRFWYMYETSEGKKWYIVDPVRGVKSELFDRIKIAADMSRLTGDPFDAKHLDIQKLRFVNNETALRW